MYVNKEVVTNRHKQKTVFKEGFTQPLPKHIYEIEMQASVYQYGSLAALAEGIGVNIHTLSRRFRQGSSTTIEGQLIVKKSKTIVYK